MRPARIVALAVVLIAPAAPVSAQSTSVRLDHPVAVVGGRFGVLTGAMATAGLLIAPPRPLYKGTSPDSSRAGLIVIGGAGTGGFSAGAGGTVLALDGPFMTTGFDALFTMQRTNRNPWRGVSESTYVGSDVGLLVTGVRVSAGFAHRTSGSSEGRRTVLTWSVGVQIPLGW